MRGGRLPRAQGAACARCTGSAAQFLVVVKGSFPCAQHADAHCRRAGYAGVLPEHECNAHESWHAAQFLSVCICTAYKQAM